MCDGFAATCLPVVEATLIGEASTPAPIENPPLKLYALWLNLPDHQ